MKKESNRNFNLLLTASTFSNLADGIAGFAYPWLFSLLTRDPLLISIVSVLVNLPRLIFVLYAGVIADKFNRQKILIYTRLGQVFLTSMFILLIFINLDSIPKAVQFNEPQFESKFLIISTAYLLAFMFGLLEVTRDNAAQAFLPQIVSKDNLPKANGRLFGIEIVTNNFLGTPVGGFLIGLSLITPFIFDTLLMLASVFFIIGIKGKFERPEKNSKEQNTSEMIKEGVNWLKNNTLLKRLAIYTGIANFFGSMQFPIMILFAQELIGLNAIQYSFLAYGAAIGGLVGSQLANKVNARFEESKTLLISVALFGIGMFAPYVTSNPFVIAGSFGLSSFGSVLWNVQAVSIRQSLIPDNLLGRVNSVYRLLALGLNPIGALFGGALVKILNNSFSREFALRFPFLLGGIFMLILFLSAPRLLSQKLINETKNNTID
ncbi:MAG: MFS transporter [Candidatus Actinomarina sp.]|jgi:MFS family permease|tara:strand:- start:235 stop:1536 length:1302 start_codon:yes stop_codon:yes gene_type:complete